MNYTIDATNKKIGRLASEIALILQGKKDPNYEPRLEGNDKVIVENIDKAFVDPKKLTTKIYYRHSTRVGHLKAETLEKVIEKKGKKEVLRRAVWNMLPKNKLRKLRIKRLIIK